jgi:hypothetical protein
MSNHIEDADKALDVLFRPAGVSVEKATAQAQLAQAHALIAIAEQLRIANLMNYAVNSPDGNRIANDVLCEKDAAGNYVGLKSDFAEALGIDGESDD